LGEGVVIEFELEGGQRGVELFESAWAEDGGGDSGAESSQASARAVGVVSLRHRSKIR
jgi:hypothetical protein